MPLLESTTRTPSDDQGYGPELALHPAQRLRRVLEVLRVLGGLTLGHPRGDGHAALGRRVQGLREVAEGDGDEVRRRLAVEVPLGDGLAVLLLATRHHAVGDARPRRRHPQREVVERLVGRLVVDGEPGVGAERLLHRPRGTVLGDGEAGGAEVGARGRRLDRLGGPGVVDRQLVLVALDEVAADDQVLAGVLELGVLAVDLDGRHLELRDEVELDVVGVAGGAERQLLLTGQRPALGVPGEVEVVVEGVDRRVADVGVDAVLERVARRGLEVGVDDAVGAGRLGRRVRGRRVLGGRSRRGVVAAAGRQAGQQGRRGERGGPAGACHSVPLSIGRTSLRPWWICALTVPSGAPTCWAISS